MIKCILFCNLSISYIIADLNEKFMSQIRSQRTFEAYRIISQQVQFGPMLNQARLLVRQYEVAVLTKQFAKAEDVKEDLTCLLLDHCEFEADDLLEFTTFVRIIQKKELVSILFAQIAAMFFEKQRDPLTAVRGIEKCCCEIQEAVECFLEHECDHDENKKIVRRYINPVLRELYNISTLIPVTTAAADGDGEKLKTLSQVYCLHCIEFCDFLVGDNDLCLKSCALAISIMDEIFREEAALYNIYGSLHNNLGNVYSRTRRYKEALTCYLDAMAAYEKAMDFESEECGVAEKDYTANNVKIVKKILKRQSERLARNK